MIEEAGKVVEDFKCGRRILFMIKARNKGFEEIALTDIAFQKLAGGNVGIMFWKDAGTAEKFILDNGRHHLLEIFEININQVKTLATRFFGEHGSESIAYVLF